MKTIARTLSLLTVGFCTSQALAYGGGNSLTCHSAANSGSHQKIALTISRSNGTGWTAPTASITVDGKTYVLKTPDEMKMYGQTIHDSPLGVIIVTASNYDDAADTDISGNFNVTAIPSSVKTYDDHGHLVRWSLQKDQDECFDANGKAKFQGLFRGYLRLPTGTTSPTLDTQILDCELGYDSGMAC